MAETFETGIYPQETLDVVAACTALIIRHKSNQADGKYTLLEKLGFVYELPVVRKALENLDQVPVEIINLTPAGRTYVMDSVSLVLLELGMKYRTADIAEEFLNEGINLAQMLVRIHNMAPVAELVE